MEFFHSKENAQDSIFLPSPLAQNSSGNCITFYHKSAHDNGEDGVLFFIDYYPGECSEDVPPVIVGHSVVVAQTEDDTYRLRTPSYVEYSESDPALSQLPQVAGAHPCGWLLGASAPQV